MRRRLQRGLFELYADDSERADRIVFGRRSASSRRGFLGGAGLAAFMTALGAPVPHFRQYPSGLIPAAWAQGQPTTLVFEGKDALVLLGDRPLVAETPEDMLDDDVTPVNRFFIRNNGTIPEPPADPDRWEVVVDGEVNRPLKMTLGELKRRFEPVAYKLQLECGGNGRSFFRPEARGNPWTNGGVGNAQWTGVRLADVLNAAGPKPSAVYTGHYGADAHLSGDPGKQALSRGLPMAKAMEPHTLLAYRMNEEAIPNVNGFPLRIVAPGFPGSASQKWLTRIWVRDRVHDGQGMKGASYRLPKFPIVPGAELKEEDTVILESMPVRSIITNPANNTRLAPGARELALRGHTWAGEKSVQAVDVSIDFGASWQRADLDPPPNKYCWQNWRTKVTLPSKGYYEAWVRATDSRGEMQPFVAGNWNPQGYGANPMHRIAVLVES